MSEARRPRCRPDLGHTVGAIYERMHKYEEAAASFTNYVNLLPQKDSSDTAAWSRAEIKFLRSFGQRVPFQMDPGAEDEVYTVDFRLVNDKVVVHGATRGRFRISSSIPVPRARCCPGRRRSGWASRRSPTR